MRACVPLLAATLLGGPPTPDGGPVPPPRDAAAAASALVEFALEAFEPETRVEDAYKWLFQATRGGEHAVADDTGPRRWLDAEWLTLGPPLPGEPLVVPLRPDGALVRLNLRPYRVRGGSKDALLAAFVASARGFRSDPASFLAAWEELRRRLARSPRGHLTLEAWERLDAEARRAGYPAVHHHEAYAASLRPSYRVLTADAAKLIGVELPAPAGSPRVSRP